MYAVYRALDLVLVAFYWILLGRVLISWLPVSRDNKLIDLLYTITEPVLAPIRNLLSRSRMMNNSMLSMFDFSPIVAFILVGAVRSVLARVFIMLIQ